MDKEDAQRLLSKTRKDYNLIARDFSRTRNKIWPEIVFLFDLIEKGDKVLDLGCGNGRARPVIKEKKAKYVGLDSSEELIKAAKERYPGTVFKKADALQLPFSDRYFDKIYSIAVFHHIPSEELRIRFLKEANRVLKKRGLLVLTAWKFCQKKEIFLLVKYTILKLLGKTRMDFRDVLEPWGKKVNRYYHCFSLRELRKTVRASGFKIKESGVIKNERKTRQNFYIIAQPL
jgi:ubiquinone/menaquinone biosynthesis C-methylase UbiE